MSQPNKPNNSQNLYLPQGNGTNDPFSIYGTPPIKKRKHSNNNNNANHFTPKYTNHATLIQEHLDQVKVVKIPGNPANTSPMYEELTHYEEIEKIVKDRQQLILTELKAHNAAFSGGSRRKTRRNKH